MDSGELVKAMRKRGVRERLAERVGEKLRDVRTRLRVSGQMEEGFWMTRGIRQGCPLSPMMLFNLLTTDLRWQE